MQPRCATCGRFLRKHEEVFGGVVIDVSWRCVKIIFDSYMGAYEHL